jgi:hypothetical protein
MDKDISLDNYYYNSQFRKHIIQFMAIFSGLKVSIGKNDLGSSSNLITVPIIHGTRDRVVSYILSEQTQNKMLRVPLMAARLTGLSLFMERLAGQGQERKDIKLPRGGSIPDDLQEHAMLKPIPYEATMELDLLASNTDQHFQMLEQILLLFNPVLQLQTSDAYGNQSSITTVTLESIDLNEEVPAGTEQRIITSTLRFTCVVYLSAPVNLKNEIIKSIMLRISATDSINETPYEINDGKIDPFIISADEWDKT